MSDTPAHYTTKPRPGGCHVPWTAALLARSQLLREASRPCSTHAIKSITKRVFPKKNNVKLRCRATAGFVVLLFFALWPRQATSFGASERNKDVPQSHAPTARKLTLDAFPCRLFGCRPGAPFPKSGFENKTERGGEEREKKKKEGRGGERGESEKRCQQTEPHHGPSLARAKRALLFG